MNTILPTHSDNINILRDCLYQSNYFLERVVHNICDGSTTVVKNGIVDILFQHSGFISAMIVIGLFITIFKIMISSSE